MSPPHSSHFRLAGSSPPTSATIAISWRSRNVRSHSAEHDRRPRLMNGLRHPAHSITNPSARGCRPYGLGELTASQDGKPLSKASRHFVEQNRPLPWPYDRPQTKHVDACVVWGRALRMSRSMASVSALKIQTPSEHAGE